MSPRTILLSLTVCAAACGGPALAQDCIAAGTVGSGGAAATENTTAATLGTGAACQTEDGTAKTIGSGGAAAAIDGKARSDTKVVANPNKLKAMSKAKAQDGGEWSKSKTKTTVTHDGLSSSTRTMSHVPGQEPIKSTFDVGVEMGGEQSAAGSIGAATGGTACPTGEAAC